MAKTEEELGEKVEEVLCQIEDKKYPVLLKEHGVKNCILLEWHFEKRKLK